MNIAKKLGGFYVGLYTAAILFSQIWCSNVYSAVVSGRIVLEAFEGAEGRVVAELEVVATDLFSADPADERTTKTDESGRFSFELKTGFWVIGVALQSALESGFALPSAGVSVEDETEISDVTLELFRADHTVSGSLVNPANEPVKGVFFYASHFRDGNTYGVEAVTDEKGEFQLQVFGGEWLISAFGLPFGTKPIRDRVLKVTDDTTVEFQTILPPPPPPLVITPQSLPPMAAGDRIHQQFEAAGGNGAYHWHLAGESPPLPDPLSFIAGGALNGIVYQPGDYTITIEAHEFGGDGTGQLTLNLTVTPDVTAPVIERWSPGPGAQSVANNSAVRVQFSERMQPLDASNRPAIRWTVEQGDQTLVLDTSKLLYDWNAAGDAVTIAHPDFLPLGAHSIRLQNALEGLEDASLFQDFGGNVLATSDPVVFEITERANAGQGEDGSGQHRPDVATILVARERLEDVDPELSDWDQTYTKIVLHADTAFSVRRASILRTGAGPVDVPYCNFCRGNELHRHVQTIDRSDRSESATDVDRFKLQLETVHDGVRSIVLDVPREGFPDYPSLLNLREIEHIPTWQDSELVIDSSRLGSVDFIQVVVTQRTPPRVYFAADLAGLTFETMVPATQERIRIPRLSFSRGSQNYVAVRSIRYVDEDQSYAGVEARAALIATTMYEVSASDPRLSMGMASTGVEVRESSPDDTNPWVSVTDGGELPSVAEVRTDGELTGSLVLDRVGEFVLNPSSEVLIDVSGSNTDRVEVELRKGGLSIGHSDLSGLIRSLLMTTPSAEIEATEASFKIEY